MKRFLESITKCFFGKMITFDKNWTENRYENKNKYNTKSKIHTKKFYIKKLSLCIVYFSTNVLVGCYNEQIEY